MKKMKIGLVVLLLAVVAVGTVFAADPISCSFTMYNETLGVGYNKYLRGIRDYGKNVPDSLQFLEIVSIERSLVGITITYNNSSSYTPGKAEFRITADFKDGSPSKTWTVTETIKITSQGTIRSTLLNFFNCNHVRIEVRAL
jgi:hypothetical protein